jgi:hypothetical protein
VTAVEFLGSVSEGVCGCVCVVAGALCFGDSIVRRLIVLLFFVLFSGRRSV